MKTLVLNGSPRRDGDTVALLAPFLGHLRGEVRVLSCHDCASPCIDCRYCWQGEGCCLDDGLKNMYPYFEACDNIVLASPVWFSELSGPLLNLASRFVQPYFAAGHFRGRHIKMKVKKGALFLCGGEPGTEKRAAETALTIMKFMRAMPCVATVTSMNTNDLPAEDDGAALERARDAALLLNRMYTEA